MPYSGVRHHCPGEKASIGSQSAGGCDYDENGRCKKHQVYCRSHPDAIYLWNEECGACKGERLGEAARAKKAKKAQEKKEAKEKDKAFFLDNSKERK